MRKVVDYDLLLAAILALGRQLHDEQRSADDRESSTPDTDMALASETPSEVDS